MVDAVDAERLALLLADKGCVRHHRHQPGVVIVEESLASSREAVAPVEDGEEPGHVETRRARDRPGCRVGRVQLAEMALPVGQRLGIQDHVLEQIRPVVPALLPVQPFRLGVLYLRTRLRQQLRGRLHDRFRVSRDRHQWIAGQDCNAQPLRRELRRRPEWHRRRFDLIAVRTRDDPESQFEIVDRARQRTESAHVAGAADLPRQVGHMSVRRHPPFGGLE